MLTLFSGVELGSIQSSQIACMLESTYWVVCTGCNTTVCGMQDGKQIPPSEGIAARQMLPNLLQQLHQELLAEGIDADKAAHVSFVIHACLQCCATRETFAGCSNHIHTHRNHRFLHSSASYLHTWLHAPCLLSAAKAPMWYGDGGNVVGCWRWIAFVCWNQ